jgi:predicted RecA/RadA family phage recombinase
MKNFIQDGSTLTYLAPSGGVVSGRLYLIGGRPVVALSTAAEGEDFAGMTRGVCGFTAAANWTAGARAFYHLTNHTVTPTSASGLLPIGTFGKAGSSGATAEVMIDGIFAVVV